MRPLFNKAFRDYRRTLLSLAIGLGAYGAMTLLLFPTLVEQRAELEQLLDSMPPQFIRMFYQGDISEFDFTDPAIFYHARYVIWVLLIVGGMLTAHALNTIIGAERNNMMDLSLSLPVTRREFLAARFLNVAAVILIILAVSFVVFAIGTQVVDEFDVGLGELALGTIGGFLPLMAQASITFALACIARSSSNWAGPVAFGYFFGGYLLMAFAQTVDLIDTISNVFLFKYYDASDIIRNGVDVTNWLVLIVVIVVSTSIAFWGFERKEIGV
ncbi:MAG: ABC transporter permease [Chloroflexi bacterium]|nr:ABC transporter permease [Chloroflexota bacterium]